MKLNFVFYRSNFQLKEFTASRWDQDLWSILAVKLDQLNCCHPSTHLRPLRHPVRRTSLFTHLLLLLRNFESSTHSIKIIIVMLRNHFPLLIGPSSSSFATSKEPSRRRCLAAAFRVFSCNRRWMDHHHHCR